MKRCGRKLSRLIPDTTTGSWAKACYIKSDIFSRISQFWKRDCSDERSDWMTEFEFGLNEMLVLESDIQDIGEGT